MSKDDLLECPYCGGRAETIYGRFYTVRCAGCMAATKICESRSEAAALWNRRAGTETQEGKSK